MPSHGTTLPEDQYDGRDDAPDPCETCGGNFEGVYCATLCEGCEGCSVSGAACHGCTCEPSPPDYGPDEYCHRCRELLFQCKCPGGRPLYISQLASLPFDVSPRQLGLPL